MLLDFADITQTSKGNLYLDIYNKIKTAVTEGIIKKGEKLPSIREAAMQLGVSRTTVENAYTKLCIEGIAESLPQKGYYIIGIPKIRDISSSKNTDTIEPIYDFSSRFVDAKASDTELWKKLVRSVLWDSGELNSYGDPQGELILRKTLSDYSYKARGVTAAPENIIIGAGMGPLLNILCGILGRNITVGFENYGFSEAKHIFSDYGIKTFNLNSDREGATENAIKTSNPDILFLLPSALSKISPTALSNRRNFFNLWAKENNKLVIEDDYNGELRYTARSIPAYQRISPENTVYIGSFSKLLIPSVRIAYMVLPTNLAEKFRNLKYPYNQTCGKIEQLALEKYITSGALEKHLKKLRRLYYTKSQLLIKELENNLEEIESITLYESSLKVEIKFGYNLDLTELLRLAENAGIKIPETKTNNTLSLYFGGISTDKIPDAVKTFSKIFKKM